MQGGFKPHPGAAAVTRSREAAKPAAPARSTGMADGLYRPCRRFRAGNAARRLNNSPIAECSPAGLPMGRFLHLPLFSGPPVNGCVSSSMLIGSTAMASCRRPFAYPLAAFSFPPAGAPSYPRFLKYRFPHVCPGFTGRPKADRPLFPLRDPAAHAACFIVWGFPNAPFILIPDRLGRLCCFFR